MRKTATSQELEGQVIDPGVIDSVRSSVFEPTPVKRFPCRVCSTPGATERSDGLCWVCSRLKFSAWRDREAQVPTLE